jgi:hypothetical protein
MLARLAQIRILSPMREQGRLDPPQSARRFVEISWQSSLIRDHSLDQIPEQLCVCLHLHCFLSFL